LAIFHGKLLNYQGVSVFILGEPLEGPKKHGIFVQVSELENVPQFDCISGPKK
jgi:hypothetical protein